jgi:hypothetical protein
MLPEQPRERHASRFHSRPGESLAFARAPNRRLDVMGSIRQASAADWALMTGAFSGLRREFPRALAERGRSAPALPRREDRLQSN